MQNYSKSMYVDNVSVIWYVRINKSC